MITIHHKRSRRILLQVAADTLALANLAGEYLIHADLSRANLSKAVLPFANLSGAVLAYADLTGANLQGANLTEADLTGADLDGANLAGATMQATVLAGCRNLHRARGLEGIRHPGPSELDEQTLRASAAYLPESFLRGVGYTRAEIRYLRSAYPPSENSEAP
ncbi:MAG: pentapeptide repeat-containing protein [Chthonomonadales bacterium]